MADLKIDYTWKRPLTTDPQRPFCSLVSLFDLIYYFDPKFKTDQFPTGAWRTRFRDNTVLQDYRMMGYQLAHTTIAFDENLYARNEGNNVNHRRPPSPSMLDQFFLYGIDICIPKFDPRVKPLFINSDNVTKYVNSTTAVNEINTIVNSISPQPLSSTDFYANIANQPGKNGLKIYPKEAAMMPATALDFTKRSPFNPSGGLNLNDYSSPPTIATENDIEHGVNDASKIEDANIILTLKDIAFMSKYPKVEEDGRSAWGGILLNPELNSTWCIISSYFNGNGDNASIKSLCPPTSVGSADFSNYRVWRYILEHTYVWVKCAFFADYIDYRDFSQVLNKDADVKHKNLVVSRKGDHKRFEEQHTEDESLLDSEVLSKNTRSYIPKTTPMVDTLTKSLIKDFNPNSNLITVKNLIDESLDPTSPIGSVYGEPFEMSDKVDKVTSLDLQELTAKPPMFFDPSSRKKAEDYDGVLPVVMPKDGNLVVDGRITSPTIDELWMAIKQLSQGRAPDPENTTTGFPSNIGITQKNPSVGFDGGYPIGGIGINHLKRVAKDTRLRTQDYPFVLSNTPRIGDPIEIIYQWSDDSTTTPASYIMDTWINNPSQINYSIINELQIFNDELCEKNGEDWNFATNAIKSLGQQPTYPVFDHIMSLREVEAFIKGLRSNIVMILRLLARDYAVTGSLGRGNGDSTKWNEAAGSTYMQHRESYGLDNPDSKPKHNTVYDDRKNRGRERANNTSLRGIGVGELTLAHFPQPINNRSPNDSGGLPSWAVYMGADGEWHSSGQALILPIYKERW